MRKKRNKEILQDVPITGYAAEGRAIARLKKENEEAGKILFVSSVIPGDRADILVVKNKKDWAEGRPIKITHFSSDRIEPFCRHFGVCVGFNRVQRIDTCCCADADARLNFIVEVAQQQSWRRVRR